VTITVRDETFTPKKKKYSNPLTTCRTELAGINGEEVGQPANIHITQSPVPYSFMMQESCCVYAALPFL